MSYEVLFTIIENLSLTRIKENKIKCQFVNLSSFEHHFSFNFKRKIKALFPALMYFMNNSSWPFCCVIGKCFFHHLASCRNPSCQKMMEKHFVYRLLIINIPTFSSDLYNIKTASPPMKGSGWLLISFPSSHVSLTSQCWEYGISLCRELAFQYETLYDYQSLSWIRVSGSPARRPRTSGLGPRLAPSSWLSAVFLCRSVAENGGGVLRQHHRAAEDRAGVLQDGFLRQEVSLLPPGQSSSWFMSSRDCNCLPESAASGPHGSPTDRDANVFG